VHQYRSAKPDRHVLCLEDFGPPPLQQPGVIALDLDDEVRVDCGIMQQPDLSIVLPVKLSVVHTSGSAQFEVSKTGFTTGWTNRKIWLSWICRVFEPGEYEVRIISAKSHPELPPSGSGHRMSLEIAGQRIERELREDGLVDDPKSRYFPEQFTVMGIIAITAAGVYPVKLKVGGFAPGEEKAVAISSVTISKAEPGLPPLAST
jgi:hypothetical protein